MKLLYHGPLWPGSTSLQRVDAFRRMGELAVVAHDTGARVSKASNLLHRVAWKVGWPIDTRAENDGLLQSVKMERPDIVIVDNSRVIRQATLQQLRRHGVSRLVYYTPDDITNRHNLKWPLRLTFPEWDVFFTTKTFNVPELSALGVRLPVLVGKSFDPSLHRPLAPTVVGEEFERFDLVFIGTYEMERCRSINVLAEAGFAIVVYGAKLGGWKKSFLHPDVVLRPSVFEEEYVRCMHHGKIALCFLRKINRDRITQRTMEIAAMGRPMLAEKTDEHDAHFLDSIEYLGFGDDHDLVEKADAALRDAACRLRLGRAARERCVSTGYSTLDRAKVMLAKILAVS